MSALVQLRPVHLLASLIVGAVLLLLALAPPAFAAGNPSGAGQPSVECGQDNPTAPVGFSTDGFANAEEHYAGHGRSADNAGSDHAVSQYDVPVIS